MQTRLHTSYSESKALKDAGLPQVVRSGDCWYQFGNEPWCELPGQHFGGTYEAREQESRAYRLDELLAFLWDRRHHFDIGNTVISWGYEERNPALDGLFSVAGADGEVLADFQTMSQEPIAVLVASVLHVLNSERSPQ